MNRVEIAHKLLHMQRAQIESTLLGLVSHEVLQDEVNKILEQELVNRVAGAVSQIPNRYGDTRAVKVGRALGAMDVLALYLEQQAMGERASLLLNSGGAS